MVGKRGDKREDEPIPPKDKRGGLILVYMVGQQFPKRDRTPTPRWSNKRTNGMEIFKTRYRGGEEVEEKGSFRKKQGAQSSIHRHRSLGVGCVVTVVRRAFPSNVTGNTKTSFDFCQYIYGTDLAAHCWEHTLPSVFSACDTLFGRCIPQKRPVTMARRNFLP